MADFSILQQSRKGLFSRLLPKMESQQKQSSSKSRRLTFASLSKDKSRNMNLLPAPEESTILTTSSKMIYRPTSKEGHATNFKILIQNREQNKSFFQNQNKENLDNNVSDQYKLFTNLIKNQNKTKQLNQDKQKNKYLKEFKLNSPNHYSQYYNDRIQQREKSKNISKKVIRPESRQKIERIFDQNPLLIKSRSSKDISICKTSPDTIQFNNTINDNEKIKQIKRTQMYKTLTQKTAIKETGIILNKICSQKQINMRCQPQQCQGGARAKKTHANYNTFPPNQYFNSWKQIQDSNQQRQKMQLQNQQEVNGSLSVDNVNTSRSSLKFDMSPFF